MGVATRRSDPVGAVNLKEYAAQGRFTPGAGNAIFTPAPDARRPETARGHQEGTETAMPDLTFRCVVEGRHGDWYAVCTDLDIAVTGRTIPEVKRSLQDAVELYVQRACELPPAERDEMLSRKSPWLLRAKLELQVWLSRRRDHDRTPRSFTLHAPACA